MSWHEKDATVIQETTVRLVVCVCVVLCLAPCPAAVVFELESSRPMYF